MIYNPDLLKKDELIRGFVARRPLLDRLVDDIRREGAGAPQHHLIIGQRGLGKTTLLRRLGYAVEDDPRLAADWLPLVFPEEQYNVAGLGDFWLNCVDALSDALDRKGDKDASAELDMRVAAVPADPATRAVQGLQLLLAEAERLKRRLLLLVDNIDIVLDRIGKDEEWEFRRVISSEPRLLIVGASSRALEAVYDHGRAFYDFFRNHELKGLDDEETFHVLRDLANQAGNERIQKLLDEQPGRIRTLRLLTGGNPRTLILLYRVLARHADGDVERDIEELLDLYTPLYKARFEELPEQSQRLVDAMALHWDPLTAAKLAELVRLSVNQVSAQLTRLEEIGVVEKTDWQGEKKTAFQIAERFFNIWYLMRASRRLRRQLLWLVRFLEAWFSKDEFGEHAREYLHRDPESMGRERYAAMSLALSERVGDGRLRSSLEHAGLRAAVEDERVRAMFDFSDLRPELRDKKTRMEKMAELCKRTLHARKDWAGLEPAEFWRLLAGSPHFSLEEKERIVDGLTDLPPAELQTLASKLRGDEQRLLDAFRRERADVCLLYETMARGEMADAYDWESALAVADAKAAKMLPYIAVRSRTSQYINPAGLPMSELLQAESVWVALADHSDLAPRAFTGLGNLLKNHLKRYEEAERAYRKAIALDPQYAGPWNGLGVLLADHLKRYEEAEQAYRKAIALDPQFAYPWHGLGNLLQDYLKRYEEAERAYRKAIALDPQFAGPWNGLGVLLADHLKRYEEAEQAYRKAIALDPQFAYPWHGLGNLLQDYLKRYEEAEQAYRKAIALDPQFAYPWHGLGNLLQDYLKRYEEAEQAYRRAIALDPQDAYPWNGLGTLLQNYLKRYEEAEQAYRRAIALDPQYALPWHNLGTLLQIHLKRYEEADQAYRKAIALDPQFAYPWNGLGNLLQYHLKRYEEADQAYRKAIALDPQDAYPWYNLGNLLADQLKRYEEAEQAYRKAIALDPQYAWPWNNLGHLLQDYLKRYEEAEQAYRKAIALDPQYAYPWSNLGRLLATASGREREACEALLEAHRLDRTRYWDLSLADSIVQKLALDSARRTDALALARRANELAPDDKDAAFTLAATIMLNGNWHEAKTMVSRLAKDETATSPPTAIFRAIVESGRAAEATRLLSETGGDQRWRPLYEALQAAVIKDPKYLNRVALEVRVAAREILQEIAPDLFE